MYVVSTLKLVHAFHVEPGWVKTSSCHDLDVESRGISLREEIDDFKEAMYLRTPSIAVRVANLVELEGECVSPESPFPAGYQFFKSTPLVVVKSLGEEQLFM